MAPPIYFLPKTTAADIAKDGELLLASLAEWGLDTIFADCRAVPGASLLSAISTAAGPSGDSGCLLMAKGEGPLHPRAGMYEPEFQEWQEFSMANCKAVWAGIDKEHPITPKDLARKTQINGYALDISSSTWTIPVIRNPEGGTGLPTDWTLLANGEVVESVQAEYRRLWEEFAGVVDVFFSPTDPNPPGLFQLDRKEAMQRCIEVLAINYRFGRIEQNLLHVVGSETWLRILSLAVDMPMFFDVYQDAQAQKKRRLDEQEPKDESPDTSPGPEDDSPGTGPAGEN